MQSIGRETVQRLCAGQVIVDLGTSVKELLENSLDAESSLVEIKLKDSGLGSISVADNGRGIDEGSYTTLCRKHWTSKISSFEDLEGVETFGFRGEALSSLCAVANVSIVTATRETAPMGVQLEYDCNGELVSQTPVARERGTTVTLTKLFAKWPVRQQDLKKNIRREYQRLVTLVEQYAIVSDNVRLSLSNQLRTSTTVAVRTMAQSDRLTRLLAVFGTQTRPHIVPFEHRPPDMEGLDLLLEGHISKPIPEAGRSASDKQYFFVNGRPCDFPKAKKLVNEMYRSHSPTRYPVFAIAISINSRTIDVNLTPDKRTILLRHEARVLEAVRQAMAQVLEPAESTFDVSRTQPQIVATATPPEAPEPQTVVATTSVPGVVRCFSRERASPGGDESASKRRAVQPSIADSPAIRIEQRTTAPPAASKPAPHPNPLSKPPAAQNRRLPTMVIGQCRNRMQNDTHDWAGVRGRMEAKRQRHAQQLEESQEREAQRGTVEEMAQGGIGNTNDPQMASTVLSRLIHKTDFDQMTIIGQFNHGFIVARHHQDLYIIDQHASDEKYNFEQLQQRAVISSQPLIKPTTLELSVVDEDVAIDFKDTLLRNGFHIRVDEEAPPGRRVALLSQPFIDQTLFNQMDLMELVGKLCSNPESTPRCERARRMFASRACRKSVMIGDPLNLSQMKAIVGHLGSLHHPWNCPHGRPTMRHLYSLP